MTWTHRWTAIVCALLVAAALPGGQRGPAPAEAGQRPVTCVTFALPAVTPSGSPAGVATVQGGAAPSSVLSTVPPIGTLAPIPVLPSIVPSAVPPIGNTAPIPIIPSVVPSAVLPITSPGPVITIPGVMLLAPHPATGAYVVPVTTAMPSAPGVSLTRPEVLIPPIHVPGQSRSAVAAGLVQSALGPAGGAGSVTPLVVCY